MKLPVNVVASYFELWLLRLLGVLPDYKRCHHCDASLRNVRIVYIASGGYLFCDKCYLKGIDEGRKVPGELVTTVNLIFKNKIDAKTLSSKTIGALPVSNWTEMLFERIVEREIKSLKSLRTIREY